MISTVQAARGKKIKTCDRAGCAQAARGKIIKTDPPRGRASDLHAAARRPAGSPSLAYYTRAWLDCAPDFAVKSTPSAKTHRSRGPSARVGVVQLRTWPVHMPPTVRQPLARPESAVGRCWSAARRPEASRIHCAPNGLIAFLGVSGVFGAG